MSDQDPSTDLANVNAAYRLMMEERDALRVENDALKDAGGVLVNNVERLEQVLREVEAILGEASLALKRDWLEGT